MVEFKNIITPNITNTIKKLEEFIYNKNIGTNVWNYINDIARILSIFNNSIKYYFIDEIQKFVLGYYKPNVNPDDGNSVKSFFENAIGLIQLCQELDDIRGLYNAVFENMRIDIKDYLYTRLYPNARLIFSDKNKLPSGEDTNAFCNGKYADDTDIPKYASNVIKYMQDGKIYCFNLENLRQHFQAGNESINVGETEINV